MDVRVLFHGGNVEKEVELNELVGELKAELEILNKVKISDLIDFFDALTKHWGASEIGRKYPYLKNISEFLEKDQLSTALKIALHGNHESLDDWVDLGDKRLMFHAQPRGLTVHWLAGNVAVLGLFSVFSAILTKNVALIKASSRGYEELCELLGSMHEVNTDKVRGKELARAIAVVLVDRTAKDTHTALSKSADVRIAWGGSEAIETIIHLPKNLFCEDIIFGPKYSYAVIDNETVTTQCKKAAQRLAIDASVFDQYACSSPHTVFVEEKEKGDALKFAEELGKQMEFVNRTILPKGSTPSGKSMEILNLRTEYLMKGRVFNSKGADWTVVYTEEEGLFKGCFSRVIFVKPIKDVAELKKLNDRQKQTLTVGMTEENKKKYLGDVTLHGIDRCPNLGFATFYESPWDGMFVFDRMVRWVTMHKQ